MPSADKRFGGASLLLLPTLDLLEMKRCRTCNRKYTDKTYEYCVDDGTPLSGAFDVDATLVLDDPFDLNATIHIDESGNETSDVTSGTHKQKKKPRKNFINDPVIAISVNDQFPYYDTGDDLYTCTRGLWDVRYASACRCSNKNQRQINADKTDLTGKQRTPHFSLPIRVNLRLSAADLISVPHT